MWKFCTKSRNIAETIVILQCSLRLCQQSSSAFEQRHLFLPKSHLPSFAVTDAWHSALSYCWHSVFFTGTFSGDQTGVNLIVQVQDCRMNVAACPSRNLLMASVVCTLVCTPPLSWRSSTLDILLVVLTWWRWAFILVIVQSSLFSCRQEVHKNITFLFPKNCNRESSSRWHTFEFWMSYHMFPLMLLTFWFKIVESGFIIHCCLWPEVCLSTVIPCIHTSLVIEFLVSLCSFVSIAGAYWAQTLE